MKKKTPKTAAEFADVMHPAVVLSLMMGMDRSATMQTIQDAWAASGCNSARLYAIVDGPFVRYRILPNRKHDESNG